MTSRAGKNLARGGAGVESFSFNIETRGAEAKLGVRAEDGISEQLTMLRNK